MLRAISVLVLVGLAGCGSGPRDMTAVKGQIPPGPATPASCGADGFQGLIGSNVSVLQTISLPSPARIMQIGSPITQDHNPARINVVFDKKRIITRVYCG